LSYNIIVFISLNQNYFKKWFKKKTPIILMEIQKQITYINEQIKKVQLEIIRLYEKLHSETNENEILLIDEMISVLKEVKDDWEHQKAKLEEQLHDDEAQNAGITTDDNKKWSEYDEQTLCERTTGSQYSDYI
jgi:hypothetical protein